MHILIVRNNSNSQAVDASLLLATYLATQGLDYTLVDSSDLSCRCDHEELNGALASGVEMAVVLGGDGTILRTARQIGTSGVPVLGINFGRLGFLANTGDEGVIAVVASALAGDVVAEQRTNLRIDVVCEGEPDPWGDDDEAAAHDVDDPARTFFALNELAVTRGANGCIIDFSLGISGAHIADMRGDGLVVATATGSTAYALSAGGPLVSPGFKGMIAVPLAPHTLRSRAVVTDASDVIEVGFDDTDEFREATLFVDGDIVPFDAPLRKIYVQCAPFDVTLLRADGASFYERISTDFFGE